MSVYQVHVWNLVGQRRLLDGLDIELQIVENYYRIKPRSYEK